MAIVGVFPITSPDNGIGIGGYYAIISDPFGSYTGRPEDPTETPIQDADDL